METQDAVFWGEATAAATVGTQTDLEVSWGAGQVTPEHFRSSASAGCGDESAISMPSVGDDTTGWGDSSNTATVTVPGADDGTTDWGSGSATAATVALSANWGTTVAVTTEAKSTDAMDPSSGSHPTDESWLSVMAVPMRANSTDALDWGGSSSALITSVDPLGDSAAASMENNSDFFNDTWGEDEGEFVSVNPFLLNNPGTSEPWGGADIGFTTLPETSSSDEWGAKDFEKTLPATSADACREPMSEKALRTGTSNQWGLETLTRASASAFSPDPKPSALLPSSVTSPWEAAPLSSEVPVYQATTSISTSSYNFLGNESQDLSSVSSAAQTSAACQGMNPERFAMLQAHNRSEIVNNTVPNYSTFEEDSRHRVAKGGNSLPLPFNRLAQRNQREHAKVSNGQDGSNANVEPKTELEAALDGMEGN